MLYKDACNRKSNQQNLGTIRCSNLCTEIVEFSSPEETAVCNLASIALPRFVREKGAARDRVRVVGSLDAATRCFLLILAVVLAGECCSLQPGQHRPAALCARKGRCQGQSARGGLPHRCH